MDFATHKLKDGQDLEIREALIKDASDILHFIHKICTESDFLTFGQGEFNISEAEEKKFLKDLNESENQIYLVTSINNTINAILSFSAGQRPRIRHSGEFSMVVQKQYWGLEL
jgi:hypothetical protein